MPSPLAADRRSARLSTRLEQAVRQHQAGRLDEAEQIYRSILGDHARQPDALHLLGVIAMQRGDLTAAADLVDQALSQRPEFAAAENTRGNILTAGGRFVEATAAFRRALELVPNEPETLHNLAGAEAAAGRIPEAIAEYRRAITLRPGQHPSRLALARALCTVGDLPGGEAELLALLDIEPEHLGALGLIGNIRLDRGNLAGAAESYCTAIRLAPEDFDANCGLGVLALRRGDPATALRHFEVAHRVAPGSVLAASNLGAALRALDRHLDALPILEAAVRAEPGHLMAQCNLGAVYLDLGRTAEALACFDRAATLAPSAAEPLANRACALADLARYPEAIAAARQALALAPGNLVALTTLGRSLSESGQAGPAIETLREAIARDPSYSEAHWNLALPLLRTGQYLEGWREFEWRFEAQRRRLRPTPFAFPRWQGEPLAGRTLLVYWEQGFGDSLHFSRYLPLLAAQGARILLQVQAPLRRLFEGFPGVAELIGDEPGEVRADYMAAMMSLPHLARTTLETIPADVPYLKVPAGVVPPLPAVSARRRIGLAWAGSPAQANNRFRSMPLAALAPLLEMPGVEWVNLQVGASRAEFEAVPAARHLLDVTDRLADFADTAALMQELDLIVTIDTSVAHLAGALARPVWLMLSHTCCWRYLLDRSDSPWYPTARLFRQPSPGDWASVVATIRAALEESAS